MSAAVNLPHLQASIRRGMDKAGTNAKRLSREIKARTGKSETLVRDILSGKSAAPQLDTIQAIADGLNVPIESLLGADGVPVVGKIGAGGTIVYDDVGIADLVPRPPDTIGVMIGLEVEGESMLPKFDPGDVIYISRDQEGVDDALIGAYCAVRLATGETYLKMLARGSEPNRFTLRSLNAADMENRELVWATAVRAILPRYARRFS